MPSASLSSAAATATSASLVNRGLARNATARPPMTAQRAPMASRSAAACPRTASTDCAASPARERGGAGSRRPHRWACAVTPGPWPRSPPPRRPGSPAACAAGISARRRRTGQGPAGTSQRQPQPRTRSRRLRASQPAGRAMPQMTSSRRSSPALTRSALRGESRRRPARCRDRCRGAATSPRSGPR